MTVFERSKTVFKRKTVPENNLSLTMKLLLTFLHFIHRLSAHRFTNRIDNRLHS